jgi:zinc/manganese transport system permease protein
MPSILWVTWFDVSKTAGIYAPVGLFHWVFRDRFLAISLHEREAVHRGLTIRGWDFLFYASFGFVSTRSVQIAGVLLVCSFLIAPAVCATLFPDHIGGRFAVGWSIGFLVSALGCSLSYVADLPTGATGVCMFGLVLLILALLKSGFRLAG